LPTFDGVSQWFGAGDTFVDLSVEFPPPITMGSPSEAENVEVDIFAYEYAPSTPDLQRSWSPLTEESSTSQYG